MRKILNSALAVMIPAAILADAGPARANDHWAYFPVWEGNLWLYETQNEDGEPGIHSINVDNSEFIYDQWGRPTSYVQHDIFGIEQMVLKASGYYGSYYTRNLLWVKSEYGVWDQFLDFSARVGSYWSPRIDACHSYIVTSLPTGAVSVPAGSYQDVKNYDFSHMPDTPSSCESWQTKLVEMSFAPTVGPVRWGDDEHTYDLIYANVYGDDTFTVTGTSHQRVDPNGLATTMVLTRDSFDQGEKMPFAMVARNRGGAPLTLNYDPISTIVELEIFDSNGQLVGVDKPYLPVFNHQDNLAVGEAEVHTGYAELGALPPGVYTVEAWLAGPFSTGRNSITISIQ